MGIDAFSRFSGMAPACSADLTLALAKQLLESTAAGSGCGRGPTEPTSRPAPGAPSRTRLSPPESRDSSSPPTTIIDARWPHAFQRGGPRNGEAYQRGLS